MSKTKTQTESLEKTAEDIREFIQGAQRMLLEFEVMMSQKEINEGKYESFETVDDLLKF